MTALPLEPSTSQSVQPIGDDEAIAAHQREVSLLTEERSRVEDERTRLVGLEDSVRADREELERQLGEQRAQVERIEEERRKVDECRAKLEEDRRLLEKERSELERQRGAAIPRTEDTQNIPIEDEPVLVATAEEVTPELPAEGAGVHDQLSEMRTRFEREKAKMAEEYQIQVEQIRAQMEGDVEDKVHTEEQQAMVEKNIAELEQRERLLEEERKNMEDRLEQETREVQERDRLHEEEKARLEEERRLVSEEKTRLEERDRQYEVTDLHCCISPLTPRTGGKDPRGGRTVQVRTGIT